MKLSHNPFVFLACRAVASFSRLKELANDIARAAGDYSAADENIVMHC
jgi:hypothetical protein